MFCPNCGTNNDAGTLFCENCGTRLEAEAQAAPQPQQPTYQPQQPTYQPQPEAYQSAPVQKKSKLPLIIIAIVVAAAIAVGCYFAFSGGDSDDEETSGSVSSSEVNDSDINAALSFVESLCYNDPEKAMLSVYPEMDGIESEIEEQCDSLRSDVEENNITFDNIYVADTQDDAEEIGLAEEYLLESYNTEASIDELQKVTVRVERTVDGEEGDVDVDVYVAKIDGKWYVIRTD